MINSDFGYVSSLSRKLCTTLVVSIGFLLLAPRGHTQSIFEQIGDTINHAVNEADKTFRDVVPIQVDFRQGGRVIVNTPTNSIAFTPGSGAPPSVTASPMANFLANLPGQPLAQAIWASKASINDARPMPAEIRNTLLQVGVPQWLLDKARFSTEWGATANFTLQQWILANGHAVAVTLDDIVVFRDGQLVGDPLLWAHELKHVEQYARLGVQEFASRYTLNSWVIENEAIDSANIVQQRLGQLSQNGNPVPGGWSQFAYFNVNGFLLYGDANRNVYPAHPATGQVIGPVIGRAEPLNDGSWSVVDSWGVRHPALRIQ